MPYPGEDLIRVLIAESWPLLREGLCLILERAADLKVDGGAATAIQVLQKLHEQRWDVILLDLEPGEDRGYLDLMHEVRRFHPKLPILVVVPEPVSAHGPRALEVGAAGCLTRESTAEDVVEGIRKVASGRMYVGPSLAEVLAFRAAHPFDRQPHDHLSEREFEVFLGLAAGEPLTQIACKLRLSAKTVSTYRTRILEKMEFHSNAQITQYALEHELIPGADTHVRWDKDTAAQGPLPAQG